MRDLRPALDLAHRHDVDAVLVIADGKADQLRQVAGGGARIGLGPGKRFGPADIRCRSCALLTHVLLPTLRLLNSSPSAPSDAIGPCRSPPDPARPSSRKTLTRSSMAFDCRSRAF